MPLARRASAAAACCCASSSVKVMMHSRVGSYLQIQHNNVTKLSPTRSWYLAALQHSLLLLPIAGLRHKGNTYLTAMYTQMTCPVYEHQNRNASRWCMRLPHVTEFNATICAPRHGMTHGHMQRQGVNNQDALQANFPSTKPFIFICFWEYHTSGCLSSVSAKPCL